MAFKFVVFAAMVAAANAGLIAQPGLAYSSPLGYASHGYAAPLAYAAPVAKIAAPLAYSAPLSYAAPVAQYAAPAAYAKVASIDADYDPNPQYSYAYDIQDGLTGDSKSQHESRSGDVVQGSYSLIDADGLKRTVDYTADPHNGFNAVVRREPIGHAVKVVAPVAKVVSPLGYASPLAYAAPVAKIAAPFGYASPLSYAAPVAKIAAPLAYNAPAYYH